MYDAIAGDVIYFIVFWMARGPEASLQPADTAGL